MTPAPRPSPLAPPIELHGVWKRYQLGSQHDSLRDAIPALVRRLTGRNGRPGAPQEGEFWALRDVSFQVRKGETLGIVGRNGAGKSTVLKLLSRIIRQTEGHVAVRGRLAALIELGGGFHPDLSGAENIYLQGTMLGLTNRQIRKLYDSIVEFSELERFLKTPVKRYSSGMVVRLGFAIAAQVRPDVLLIDEVLAVGDLSFQQKCFKRIAELKQLGTTMIFISHGLEAVQKLCDRVLLLREGRVIGEGDPAEMIQRYRRDVLAARPQTDSAARRPDGPVAITRIDLLDEQGRRIEELETGAPMRLDIAVEASRPIRQPTVRISIERLDGLLCHAATSPADGSIPSAISGPGVVSLEYPAMNLLPNSYQVIVEIFEGQSPAPLASARHRCFFHVNSDHHERGVVHLDHAWGFSAGPAGRTEPAGP